MRPAVRVPNRAVWRDHHGPPRPLTAGLSGRMVFQGTRRPDATLHLVYLDADSRADAALDRIRRTVDNAPTNVEALLTRLEVAAIAGSADAGQYPEPLLAESSDAPTTLIWHSVKLFYAYELHLSRRKG